MVEFQNPALLRNKAGLSENKAGLSQEPSHVTIQFTILILKTFAWLEEFAYLCNWIIFQDLEYLSQGLVYIFQGLKHRPLNRGVNNSTKHKKKNSDYGKICQRPHLWNQDQWQRSPEISKV